MRQASDERYAQLLSRARVGMLSEEDVILLKSWLVDVRNVPFSTAIHIYAKVHEMNGVRQSQLSSTIYTVVELHEYTNRGDSSNIVVASEHIPKDDRDASGLPRVLNLSLNSRVMLCRNILTASGLVNGLMGMVTGFEFHATSGLPSLVYVQFDDPTAGLPLQLPSRQWAIAGYSIRRTKQGCWCNY